MTFENVKDSFKIGKKSYRIYRISKLKDYGYDVDSLPYSLRIILENLIRRYDENIVKKEHLENLLNRKDAEIPFFPERIILQDYTGIPVVLDLVAMRNTLQRINGDAEKINPVIPVEVWNNLFNK